MCLHWFQPDFDTTAHFPPFFWISSETSPTTSCSSKHLLSVLLMSVGQCMCTWSGRQLGLSCTINANSCRDKIWDNYSLILKLASRFFTPSQSFLYIQGTSELFFFDRQLNSAPSNTGWLVWSLLMLSCAAPLLLKLACKCLYPLQTMNPAGLPHARRKSCAFGSEELRFKGILASGLNFPT